MTSRTWLILSLGFGTLILLIALLGFGGRRRAQTLHDQTVSAHEAYLRADAVLREIPSDLYLSGVLIRDYLLDPSHLSAPSYREKLREAHSSIGQRLELLTQRLGPAESRDLERLQKELKAYWDLLDPILDWTPQQKMLLSRNFLREQVLPRREAVVALAREITEINAGNLRQEQQRLQGSQQIFQSFLRNTVLAALALGLVVAVISTWRVASLERRSEQQRERAERAEEELRRLSRRLVQTQEEERKWLSRELHDAIGQMLSAMTMELGNIEAMIGAAPERLRERLNEARRLNAETLRGVRDLAMGLRPAMLDELGLGPAIRWQGRQFSLRCGVPVTVQVDGGLEGLPDPLRSSIYRIVQEALTNCARHAHAKNIRVALYGRHDAVSLSIQDDGVGFDPASATRRGLGLIGIQERVRELEGEVKITSQPGKGTIVEVEVPVVLEPVA